MFTWLLHILNKLRSLGNMFSNYLRTVYPAAGKQSAHVYTDRREKTTDLYIIRVSGLETGHQESPSFRKFFNFCFFTIWADILAFTCDEGQSRIMNLGKEFAKKPTYF